MNNRKLRYNLLAICFLLIPSVTAAAEWRVNTIFGEVNSEDSLDGFFLMILNGIYGIAGLITVIRIIMGGYRYMSAAGNPAEAKRAKETIIHAVEGLVTVLIAFLFTNLIMGTFSNGSPSANES